ncbi:MAG: hypothetical protein JHC93_06295, partial [Parachlamydiales bacterium]|nr:hypothetical protein [Parachlamydiales bacterium]
MPTVLQTLPDYDETVYTKKQFLDNLQVLADKTDQVKVCSNHRSFYLASRVQQVFYRVISHLGFEDRCNIIKVNYDILKFFHNGCINHYFLTLDVQNLLKSVQATMDDPNVKEAANEVLSLKPDIKEKLQAILLNYYNKHHSSLQPAFWHRFFMRKVDINFKNFGDTYNHLAQVELEKKHVSATIHYYKLLIAQGAFSDETAIFVAAKLIEFIDILPANNKNRDIVFDILQSLADRYYAQKKYQITQSFLAPIARYGADLKLKQKAMLGVCYLNMDNRESSAYPYLNDVLRVNPSDLFLKEKVADVLFSKQEWDKALAIYTPLFENKKELKIKMIECYCQ